MQAKSCVDHVDRLLQLKRRQLGKWRAELKFVLVVRGRDDQYVMAYVALMILRVEHY